MAIFKKNQNERNGGWIPAFFEKAPIILFRLDSSGFISEIRGRGLTMMNLSDSEIIGQPIFQIFEFPGGVAQYKSLLNGEISSLNTSLNNHNLEIYIDCEADAECHYGFVIVAAEPGTQDNVFQELKESEERHRAIWENSPMGICVTDKDGYYRFVNPAYCRIYGYATEELIGRKLFDLIFPDELRMQALEHYREIFRQNKAIPMGQTEFVRSDGEQIWVQYAADFVRRNGEPRYLVSMNSDITERRRVETALEISQKRYQELFNSVMEGLGLVDENEIVQYCNPAFAAIFGESSVQDMIGKNIVNYLGENEKNFILAETQKRKNGQYSKYELDIMTARHVPKTIWVTVSPRFDDTGKYIGAFGAVVDITERKQSEIRSQARLKLLEELRHINDIDGCLTCGCQAIYMARLYRRAVITLHDENRRIINLGQIGLDDAVIRAARQAPAPDKENADKMTDQRYRLSHSYFIPTEESTGLYKTKRYILQSEQWPMPDSAWQVGDEFFSPIIGPESCCEGWLSVDTPFSGKRPTLKDAVRLEELLNIVAKKVNELKSLEMLKRERQTLEQKNIALSEVFARIEEEKRAIKQQLVRDVDSTLMPAYKKLLNADGTLNSAAYNILGIGLQAAATSTMGILNIYAELSPREIEICELLKSGKRSAEAARELKISKATMRKHREMIRKRLGLKNKKVNLISYLKAQETQ